MKKILFLQIKGNFLGGIWYVDKSLGEEFLNRGYDVAILGIRNNHPGLEIKDTPLKITTINTTDIWEITHRRDVLNKVGRRGFFKTLNKYFADYKKLNDDYVVMKKMISEYNPDYIIATHYQTLKGIPDQYLNRTIFVQHSSFNYLLDDKNNVRTLKRLNDKINSLCWLCESTMNRAIDFGFKKNKYIYNPNKFLTNLKADVVKNKKIVIVTRIHAEKRIDLMIDLVNEVFKNPKFKDWVFEIYGVGSFNRNSEQILKHSNQIIYKGLTDNAEKVLMNASLTLNTSVFEGFSLSIIESFSCGLPVIAFNFGESAHEQIINDYNGYVIENDNVSEFKEKLEYLLSNEDKLLEMSCNAKEFSSKFEIDRIADQWEKVFEQVEEENAKS